MRIKLSLRDEMDHLMTDEVAEWLMKCEAVCNERARKCLHDYLFGVDTFPGLHDEPTCEEAEQMSEDVRELMRLR